MKQSKVDKLNIQKPQGIFTPNYSYAECLVIKNEDGEVVDYEYIDFILYKTAEEVYQEYLNPQPSQPSQIDYTLDLDFRLSKIELGI